MGTNRDKNADLANTLKVLSGQLLATLSNKSWLGHKNSTRAYKLDLLLLKGVDDATLSTTSGAWRNHIDHLRYAHGLDVRRDKKDCWKITGQAYTENGKRTNVLTAVTEGDGGDAPGENGRMRNPISDKQYRAGYELGRDVFYKKKNKAEAINLLVQIGTNEVSAANMLYIAFALLAGENFKRALKDEAYGWYLEWIYRDNGPEGLRTALKSARMHLAYRELDGANRWQLRDIIERYERILNGEPVDAEGEVDDADSRSEKGAKKKLAFVTMRYGQPEFRKNLLEAYKGRCAVTGCAVERVLEAAHIRPYSNEGASRVSNGLLLRSDIHALFDANLLGIDPTTYKIKLSVKLMGDQVYWVYEGKEIDLPQEAKCWPDKNELAEHLKFIS